MIDAARLVLPAVWISCDGGPVDTALLASVRVRREAACPAACEVRFERLGGQAALADLPVGAELDLGVADSTLFRGDVLTVEHRAAADGRRELVVRAQDRTHRWRQDSRTRAFVDLTVGEIIAEVAAEAELSCQIDADGPRWPRYLQDGRSTLALVRDLAARAGLTWHVDSTGRTVRVTEIGAAHGEPVNLTFGRDLIEAETRSTALGGQDGWRVTGWDPVTGSAPEGSASSGGAPERATGSGEGVRAGVTLATEDHASATARAFRATSAARARSAKAVALGDPRLVPGSAVRLDGIDADPGPYVVTEVEHVIDGASGYVCVLGSAPPDPPARAHEPQAGAALAATTPGRVIDIDDPERRGRVRVALVGLDGLESEWLPVLALGAGEGKGFVCQPDLDDVVLVAHGADDPGRGVVLGSLRSEEGTEPGVGVADGAVGAYALRLASGQTLRLAREGNEVSLDNGHGSRIVLDRTGVRVHAAGDLRLEAPRHRITLRADAIEMERG